MSDGGLGWWASIGFVVAAAMLWVQYFDLKDCLRPEPRSRQLAAFALGALAAVLAMGLFLLAGKLGLPTTPGTSRVQIAFYCFLLVGPIEEGAKFLFARFVVFRWDVFDEEVDGLVYTSAIALGFASVENLLYLPSMSLGEGLLRALASPITHAVFAAPWGIGLARARLAGVRPGWRTLLGLAMGMLAHGLYDHLLLAHGATVPAAGVVLLLWILLIARARGALHRDSRRFAREARNRDSERGGRTGGDLG